MNVFIHQASLSPESSSSNGYQHMHKETSPAQGYKLTGRPPSGKPPPALPSPNKYESLHVLEPELLAEGRQTIAVAENKEPLVGYWQPDATDISRVRGQSLNNAASRRVEHWVGPAALQGCIMSASPTDKSPLSSSESSTGAGDHLYERIPARKAAQEGDERILARKAAREGVSDGKAGPLISKINPGKKEEDLLGKCQDQVKTGTGEVVGQQSPFRAQTLCDKPGNRQCAVSGACQDMVMVLGRGRLTDGYGIAREIDPDLLTACEGDIQRRLTAGLNGGISVAKYMVEDTARVPTPTHPHHPANGYQVDGHLQPYGYISDLMWQQQSQSSTVSLY